MPRFMLTFEADFDMWVHPDEQPPVVGQKDMRIDCLENNVVHYLDNLEGEWSFSGMELVKVERVTALVEDLKDLTRIMENQIQLRYKEPNDERPEASRFVVTSIRYDKTCLLVDQHNCVEELSLEQVQQQFFVLEDEYEDRINEAEEQEDDDDDE